MKPSGTNASSGQVKVEAKNTIDFTKVVYLSSNATDVDKNKWKSLQVGSKENRNKETIFRKGGSETSC